MSTLHQLIHVAKKMREAQKGFFKSKQGTTERFKFLKESKEAEATFDKLLIIVEEEIK